MKTWPYEVTSLQWSEIEAAVKDDKWQQFRLSLKGRTTWVKLDMLGDYVEAHKVGGHLTRVQQVRVDNYINALLRGGQLVRQGNEILVQR